jgi:hypothetical protein
VDEFCLLWKGTFNTKLLRFFALYASSSLSNYDYNYYSEGSRPVDYELLESSLT